MSMINEITEIQKQLDRIEKNQKSGKVLDKIKKLESNWDELKKWINLEIVSQQNTKQLYRVLSKIKELEVNK